MMCDRCRYQECRETNLPLLVQCSYHDHGQSETVEVECFDDVFIELISASCRLFFLAAAAAADSSQDTYANEYCVPKLTILCYALTSRCRGDCSWPTKSTVACLVKDEGIYSNRPSAFCTGRVPRQLGVHARSVRRQPHLLRVQTIFAAQYLVHCDTVPAKRT